MPPEKEGTVDYRRCRLVKPDHVLEMATYRYQDRPDVYITGGMWLPLPAADGRPQRNLGTLYIESHSAGGQREALQIVAGLRPRIASTGWRR